MPIALPRDAVLEVALIPIGAWWIALDAAAIRGATRAPEHEDADAPTLAERLGLADTGIGAPHPIRLTLRGARGDWPLAIPGLPEWRSLPAMAVRPLPPAVALRAHPRGLRALAFDARRLLLIIDARRLEPLAPTPVME